MAFFKYVTQNMQYFVGGGLVGVFCVSVAPQTLGLGFYRRAMAQYKDGNEEPLSPYLADMTQQVLDTIVLRPEAEAAVDFFSVYGSDSCYKGSVMLRSGTIIGIPTIFNYTSEDDIPKDSFQMNLRKVNWQSQGGEMLSSSLLLSEQAKRFAVAREIMYSNTHHVWVSAFFKVGFGALGYTAGFMLNNLMDLRNRLKRWGRFGVYGMLGVAAFALYILATDTYSCSLDYRVDRNAARIGREYAEGGLEYYTKLLERNKAFRLLMGKEGATFYTVYGNEVATWRRKHLQVTERRDNLEGLVRAYDIRDKKQEADT